MPAHAEFLINPPASEGRRFVALDRQMDRAVTGPVWLKDPNVAAAVKEIFLRASTEWKLFGLFAWVIMSHHVHLLFQPHKKLADIMCTLKSASSREANRILGRSGEPFWQGESYDRWVRNKDELAKIAGYIENNPVTAGLVNNPEDYPWSS